MKSVKQAIYNNTKFKKQKLQEMERNFKINELDSEQECKETYFKLVSDKDQLKQLYKNIDIEFEFAVGDIPKKEYDLQMNNHKQMIDKILCSLSYETVTCEDLLKLYGSE